MLTTCNKLVYGSGAVFNYHDCGKLPTHFYVQKNVKNAPEFHCRCDEHIADQWQCTSLDMREITREEIALMEVLES